MTKTFDLTAVRHRSRVLDAWLLGRDEGERRTGVIRAENERQDDIGYDRLARILGAGAQTAAGQAVTESTAMRVAAVYGCVSLIAGAISTIPLPVYERAGPRRVADHPYWWIFNEQACDEYNAADAWTLLLYSKLLLGDGYAELLRPSPVSSRVIGFKPFHKDQVHTITEGGRKVHRVTEDGRQRVLDDADMIQLSSLGYDGCDSPSPIQHAAREAIGTSLAGQQYHGRFFSGGATFDFALHTESALKPDQLKTLKDSVLARMESGSRAPLILSGGLKPTQLSINPRDAEVLSTRLFSVEEICRIYGVPPHMIGHTSKSTSWGTGLEQQSAGFVRYTLQRHLTQIAQELNRKLWPSRATYMVAHDTNAMVRGDMAARFSGYRQALGRAGEPGFMTINEVRAAENLPPVDGGDELMRASAVASGGTAEDANRGASQDGNQGGAGENNPDTEDDDEQADQTAG